MSKITLSVGSVTYAIKVKNLLRKNGINCTVTKIDFSESGCTHGVEIEGNDLLDSAAILRREGIRYTAIGKEK